MLDTPAEQKATTLDEGEAEFVCKHPVGGGIYTQFSLPLTLQVGGGSVTWHSFFSTVCSSCCIPLRRSGAGMYSVNALPHNLKPKSVQVKRPKHLPFPFLFHETNISRLDDVALRLPRFHVDCTSATRLF